MGKIRSFQVKACLNRSIPFLFLHLIHFHLLALGFSKVCCFNQCIDSLLLTIQLNKNVAKSCFDMNSRPSWESSKGAPVLLRGFHIEQGV